VAGIGGRRGRAGGGWRRCPRRWFALRAWPGSWAAGTLYVKRDDLTGFAFAGNKARPLEFLVAAALGEGADTLVTGGAPGSNFCAATAGGRGRGPGCAVSS